MVTLSTTSFRPDSVSIAVHIDLGAGGTADSPLEIDTIEVDARTATVQLAGELDAFTVKRVSAAVVLIGVTSILRRLLGLSRLSFCDAGGLSGILELHRRLATRHESLAHQLTGVEMLQLWAAERLRGDDAPAR